MCWLAFRNRPADLDLHRGLSWFVNLLFEVDALNDPGKRPCVTSDRSLEVVRRTVVCGLQGLVSRVAWVPEKFHRALAWVFGRSNKAINGVCVVSRSHLLRVPLFAGEINRVHLRNRGEDFGAGSVAKLEQTAEVSKNSCCYVAHICCTAPL